jgi:hypothetical protein
MQELGYYFIGTCDEKNNPAGNTDRVIFTIFKRFGAI